MSTVCSGGSTPSGKGGGGGHPDPEIRVGGGEGRSQKKNFFRPFGPQFGLKIRGRPGPSGSCPGSATGLSLNILQS